ASQGPYCDSSPAEQFALLLRLSWLPLLRSVLRLVSEGGFRQAWCADPQVVSLYRERDVTSREHHPEHGRYRYEAGYRSSARDREGGDDDEWKSGRSSSSERFRGSEVENRRTSRKDQEHPRQGRNR